MDGAFQELLNRPRPEEPLDIPAAETDLDMSMERPSMAEIVRAIKSLKSGKAVESDCIPPEYPKSDTQTSAGIFYTLFGNIWNDEELSNDWKEGYLLNSQRNVIFMNARTTDYRGICLMLLSIPGKILSRVLLDRLREAVDPKLREEQADFRKGRSCPDQITTVRIIV